MDTKLTHEPAAGLEDGLRETTALSMQVALCLGKRPQPAVEAALQAAGHQVKPYRSGAGLLSPPDVVIVDCEVLNDRDATRDLAELSQRIAVLVVTDKALRWPRALDEGLRAAALLPYPIEITCLLVNLPLWVQRQHEARALRKAEADLLAALLSSRRISSAVGILAERHGISVEEAFNRLRNQARANRQRTEDLAVGIVSGEDPSG